MRCFVLLGGMASACLMSACASAQEDTARNWDDWLARLQQSFIAEGIAPETFASALKGRTPDERVLQADSHQPEFTRPIWEYLESAVSAQRIMQGREMLAQHKALLERITREHGVAAETLVAIWGIETSYGGNKGGFHVPRSLATLAYGSERHDFGRTQLLSALRLLQEGVMPADAMLGSWAGAMGHMQFLPSNYETYGIDFDGDGVRDLSGSEADALASAALFLKASGWQSGEAWGGEVLLPDGFDHALARASITKPTIEWSRLGVRAAHGALPSGEGFLLLPAGHRGPAFLVLQNFEVLKRYNPSTAYALAVARLSDCLRGCNVFAGRWPVEDGVLSFNEKMRLQQRLTALGYDTSGIDGIIGPATRAALRSWQASEGEVVDGYATRALLHRLAQ